MSEHKFKAGDIVRDEDIEEPSIPLYYPKVPPLLIPDQDVVERVARAMAIKDFRLVNMSQEPTQDWVDAAWPLHKEIAQAAITALTSSGYTRSPKPDVNQMMLEALKVGQSWLERWAQHVGNCRAGSECTCGLTRVRYDLSAAIAAGSEV